MKTIAISRVINHVKSAAITMALSGFLISSGAPLASAQTGWAVGKSGRIIYTSDGKNWSIQGANVILQDLNSVASVDGSAAWAVGDAGTIVYGSQNAAKQWIWVVPKGVDKLPKAHLRSVSFGDATHGYAVGDSGTILFL